MINRGLFPVNEHVVVPKQDAVAVELKVWTHHFITCGCKITPEHFPFDRFVMVLVFLSSIKTRSVHTEGLVFVFAKNLCKSLNVGLGLVISK